MITDTKKLAAAKNSIQFMPASQISNFSVKPIEFRELTACSGISNEYSITIKLYGVYRKTCFFKTITKNFFQNPLQKQNSLQKSQTQIAATDEVINTLVYKLYDLIGKDEFFEVPLFVFCFGFILSLCDAVALGAP